MAISGNSRLSILGFDHILSFLTMILQLTPIAISDFTTAACGGSLVLFGYDLMG